MGPFVITRCCTNITVALQFGATKIRYNIRCIYPYTSDTKIEDIKCWGLIIDDVTLGKYQLYTSVFTSNPGIENYNWIHTGTLMSRVTL